MWLLFYKLEDSTVCYTNIQLNTVLFMQYIFDWSLQFEKILSYSQFYLPAPKLLFFTSDEYM